MKDEHHSGTPNEVPYQVLVVDDSAFSRAILSEAIEAEGCEVIGRAMDGSMALRMVLERAPDVITCDLEMPGMDGFTFLRALNARFSIPVVVVTSDARPEVALQALELGARDFVVKPDGGAASLRALGPKLACRVLALARAQHVAAAPQWTPVQHIQTLRGIELVVIGASTGGPRALRDTLGRFPRELSAPVVIAQHMPAKFTRAFAERLKRSTGLDVTEAVDGEILQPGMIRVGPGGSHVLVEKSALGFVVRLDQTPSEDRHVPSVDRLLASAAEAAGKKLLAVVLTGMGRDGAEGAKSVAACGGALWTESEATAVIPGMPMAAARSHPGSARLPLDELARLLAKVLTP